MVPLFLASLLTCADASWIVEGMLQNELVTETERAELIDVLLEAAPDDCDWEGNLGRRYAD